MQRDFAIQFTGWTFVAAGVMLWAGWLLMPVHIGTYFAPQDFAQVHSQFHFWIWMYRVHIFGYVLTAMALLAVGSLLVETPARILIWPGAGVAVAGTFVSALAAAFYYHHGAWGALELHGKGTEDIFRFITNLKVDTEYVTCLVRFGRVFSGLGLLVLGLGFLKWKVFPFWVGGVASLMGLAAMALTMALPDRLSLYMPIFHFQSAWLVSTGIELLRSGFRKPSVE